MYPNLKLTIFKRGLHQNRLAWLLGINEAILSKIIHGYREPSAVHRKKLADYLEADENWLFEKFDSAKMDWVEMEAKSSRESENDKS